MSQNYEKILNAEDYNQFFTVYDIVKPTEIPTVLAGIKEYLQNSYMLANKVRSAIKPISVSDSITLIDALHAMASDMLTPSERCFGLISHKDDIHVSMTPFLDFLETMGGLKNIIDDMSIMLNCMRNYLSSQNVEQYKSYSDFIEMLMIIFENINQNHKPLGVLMAKSA